MFEASVRDGSFKLPSAAVVQFIPTEACNLRCAFCNQWGDAGYFLAGARKVESMNSGSITSLIEKLSPRDSMINVHGGEPFAYKHIDSLLDALGERAEALRLLQLAPAQEPPAGFESRSPTQRPSPPSHRPPCTPCTDG